MTHTQDLQNRDRYSDSELDRRTQFDRSRPLERDETGNLISSNKVEGTSVYSTDGEKLGSIDHLMIGKRSGRVEYSVMSFGGFLGIGEQYRPVGRAGLRYRARRLCRQYRQVAAEGCTVLYA